MKRSESPDKAGMWVVALLFAGLIFGAFSTYWADFWIYQDGRQITATISAERSHGVWEYDYVANGVDYVGAGLRGKNLKQDAHIGEQVLVWVSASRPQYSSPEMLPFSPWRISIVVAVLFVAEFFAVRSLVRMYRPANKTPRTAATTLGR